MGLEGAEKTKSKEVSESGGEGGAEWIGSEEHEEELGEEEPGDCSELVGTGESIAGI